MRTLRTPEDLPENFVCYHTGFLARDRERDPALHLKAAAIYAGCMAHDICLVQRRVQPFVYNYCYVAPSSERAPARRAFLLSSQSTPPPSPSSSPT